jgi:hypothetical protein
LTPERIAQMEKEKTPEGSDEVLKEPAAAVAGRRFKRASA